MTERRVADELVDRMHAWGVRRIFGYSGDGINGLMGALRRAGTIALVQARHEENAALMAVGHAKYTGGVGVVTSTQGPGAVHLLNGLYDAKLDHVPVVAVVGQQQRSALGSEYQQEIDLQTLFKDVAAQYVQTVMAPEQATTVLDRAFRTAIATRSPCVVIVPHDVQTLPADPPGHGHGEVPTTIATPRPRVLPHEDDVARAAALLREGRRPAILLGQGARDAGPQARAVAERLGAGVTTSLLGKPYWDESLPTSCGVMGHLGTHASGWLMDSCDSLLLVGTNDPWTEFYPAPGQARAVQIDLDGRHLGNRYPVEVALTGDAGPTLEALLDHLGDRPANPDWRHAVEASVRDSRVLAAERAALTADPLNPEAVIRALSGRLPDDARVAVDVGSVTYWYARQLRLPPGVPAHLSSTLATMGSALPYGLAAKLDDPSRPVVALAGDGAMQMNGVAELITVADRWRDWADPRFVVLVLANRDLAEVTWEQREMEKEPRFDASQDLPGFPYADYGRLLGLGGVRVDSPEEVDDAWTAALAADRPFVLEAVVDPDVPLLPPFPAGEAKLDDFRTGLAQEGNAHARELLDLQADQERACDPAVTAPGRPTP